MHKDSSVTHASSHESLLHEYQFKAKLYYSHRNLYISLFSIVMVLVLFVRGRDMYRVCVLEEELKSLTGAKKERTDKVVEKKD